MRPKSFEGIKLATVQAILLIQIIIIPPVLEELANNKIPRHSVARLRLFNLKAGRQMISRFRYIL
jgi:hypothetical protein